MSSTVARSTGRLDPRRVFNLAGAPAVILGAGRSLASMGGVWAPGRFKRTYATANEAKVPYLRPYDVFDYLPGPADWLSVDRSQNLSELVVKEGTLLQTCSGRNLGPAVSADAYLAQFAFSHDLVRIEIENKTDRLVALAYLRTDAGRRAITLDRAGSVIDHLTPGQVGAVTIPDVDDAPAVADLLTKASRLRALARKRLRVLQAKTEAMCPLPEFGPRRDGWTVSSSRMHGRIDSAYYDPLVLETRARLQAMGSPTLADLAVPGKPGGRYSPRYVGPGYGEPLLSGRQVLQWHPIALKHVALMSFRDVEPYRLSAGTIVYQADGRAEEALGTPAVVTPQRTGWLASGHVGRLRAREGVRWGAVYLGLASNQGQSQLRATASGSVVDSTFNEDVAEVLVPSVTPALAASAERAWCALAAADTLESKATAVVEAGLARAA